MPLPIPSQSPKRPEGPPSAPPSEELPEFYFGGASVSTPPEETFTQVSPQDEAFDQSDELTYEPLPQDEAPEPPSLLLEQLPEEALGEEEGEDAPEVKVERAPLAKAKGKTKGTGAFATSAKKGITLGKKPKRTEASDDVPAKKGTFFVDEKRLKLKPFGSGRTKETYDAKTSDFDERKNLRRNAGIYKWVTIGLLASLVGLGTYQAVNPNHGLSAQQATAIAQHVNGQTGFPLERGKGFAQDFMKAYLTVNPDDPVSSATLNYFYSGSVTADSGTASNRDVSAGTYQTVLYGPTIYKSESYTAYSAQYTVGALVAATAKGTKPPSDGSNAKWSFFTVNVYYDKTNDRFLVATDSPNAVPPVQVGNVGDLPEVGKLGTGETNSALNDALASVVNGYIKGYAISSLNDHSAIDQYIIPNPPVDLLKGLNKRYVLAGTDSNAIDYTTYLTTDPNVVKVQVKVKWRDSASSKAQLDYTSTYVMTLNKQTNGKYLVSKFVPEYYTMDGGK